VKRTRIGRPSRTSSHRNVPTPASKEPRTGRSMLDGLRPSIHQIDHCLVAGSNVRRVAAR
jgi:hypothetical protein